MPWHPLAAVVDADGRNPGDPEQQGSADWHRAFARRHRQALNELVGTVYGKEPSDWSYRFLSSRWLP